MGARIVTYNRLTGSREELARDIQRESGATLVPPFDHPKIMAGQGTAGMELLEEAGALDALVTPLGGGGLLSGCATIAKAMQPGIRVFGVEPETANDGFLSVAAGRLVEVPHPETIADGLRTPRLGEQTFPVIQKLVEQVVLVSDDELRATAKFLLLRMKILVEPSGAAAAAAVLFGKLPKGIGRVGVVLSGGNVDFEELAKW